MTRALRRLGARLGGGARALHEDEEGASLVFAACTLFALGLLTVNVYQVGRLSTERLQIQTAADAAAYSGAQVEANALNAIGQLNDAMAYVHYTTLRHVVDSIVYGTLAEFTKHDEWVRRNASFLVGPMNDIMSPWGRPSSPGIPTEAGSQAENRKAYDWVMLGDERAWTERWQKVQRHEADRLVEKGKTWLEDLNAANRLILATTPRLVREKAVEVAALNGASHVAVSSDLDRAFRLTGQGAGFSDGAQGGARDEVPDVLVRRYSDRSLEVDGRARSFPSWFEPRRGRAGRGYSQVRLCWNRNDWAHRERAEAHLDFPMFQSCPNGHWHAKHAHVLIDEATSAVVGFPVPKLPGEEHGGLRDSGDKVEEVSTGSGSGGGHFEDDSPLHTQAQQSMYDFFNYEPMAGLQHHADIRCPTCLGGQRYDMLSMWSEVRKTQRDARDRQDRFELRFDGVVPRPILLREAALRSGVVVVAWGDSKGIGDWETGLFPAPPWGTVGIAAAQVGYQTDEQVELLRAVSSDQARYEGETVPLEGERSKPRNLFYSKDPAQGVRFGARLVPLARDLTYHPDQADGKAIVELLEGRAGSRTWWVASSGRDGQRPGRPQQIDRLREWVTVRSGRDVQEVLWH